MLEYKTAQNQNPKTNANLQNRTKSKPENSSIDSNRSDTGYTCLLTYIQI